MSLSTQPASQEDLDAVKDWFRELAEHVQAVDFAAARHLFAEDFVAFGTFTQARATSGSRLCLRVRYWFNPVT
jgi:ketosteroid isomerase-like protein